MSLFASDKLGREKLKKPISVAGVKICQNLGSENDQKVENCYIVVSTFFAKTGPPRTPPKNDIFWPPLDEKYRRFCGEWDFKWAHFWGRFWGSKSGPFLQKVPEFQKIYKRGGPGSPIQKSRFLIIFNPLHFDIYKRHFSIIF
jgi:hypothetical protein